MGEVRALARLTDLLLHLLLTTCIEALSSPLSSNAESRSPSLPSITTNQRCSKLDDPYSNLDWLNLSSSESSSEWPASKGEEECRLGKSCVLHQCLLKGQEDNASCTLRDIAVFEQEGRQHAILDVPSSFRTLRECILYSVRHDDIVYIRAVDENFRSWPGGERGWHTWKGVCWLSNEVLWLSRKPRLPHTGARSFKELKDFCRKADEQGLEGLKVEKVQVKGYGFLRFLSDPGAKVSGQILLGENTTGEFKGPMVLALLSNAENHLPEEAPDYWWYSTTSVCAISIRGPSWSFKKCEIRSSGGTSLRCDAISNVRLIECSVGGVLAYAFDGRLCKAVRAVSVVRQARCVLKSCSIEFTEVHKYDYLRGGALKLSDSAEAVVEDCIFHSHDGVAFLWDEFTDAGPRTPNSAKLRLSNSVIKQCGVATFSVRGEVQVE
eukprot:754086-Hanusia_phi.AAC.8